MALYLANFAKGEKYKGVQELQRRKIGRYFSDVFEYNDQFLMDCGYYFRNKDVIDNSTTGWGYCGWKGTILLDAMSKVNDNDLILYSDVADEIYNSAFYDWLILRTNQMNGHFFNLNYYIQGLWTKKDCFVLMNCDLPEFWHHRQLEAGTIGLVKQPDNIALLKEWTRWCETPQVIDKSPNKLGENMGGFVDHRTDQSILTNLVISRGWETEYMENIRAYIKYNEFDKFEPLDKHTRKNG
jgi:hypothetical protein